MRNRMITAVALVGALALLATACGGNDNKSSGATSTSAAGATTTSGGTKTKTTLQGSVSDHGTKAVPADNKLEVEADNDGSDFSFNPTYIQAKAGSTVTVELKNAGSLPHTFTIDSLQVDETLQPGDAKSVEVKVPTTLTTDGLRFYCKFHSASGMQGAIVPAA